ncbi:hypothetical protein ABT095_07295 [Kitasatospora sp. NPDC002227]|uniref:hypothetical protein n=1 Tax=Kitasatospora sp. NPDC002227 TaxID=3154773 RepID=UPI00332B572C
MFYLRPGEPHPHVPPETEQLAVFGHRFAMLAELPEEWGFSGGSDGGAEVCGVSYALHAAPAHLVVTTFRGYEGVDLASELQNLAMNAEPPPEHLSIPEWLDSWDFVRELETTTTSLRVDGSEVAGWRIGFEGYFAVRLVLAEEEVFVSGRAVVEPLARDLVMVTEPRGRAT